MTKTAEYALLLILMIYFHIIDDFYLQGILAKLKQKEWWKDNADDDIYRGDYVIALLEHAFSWAVTVHIPVLFIYHAYSLPLFLGAFVLHAIIDDLKANKKVFGLAIDQLLHMIQIEFLWMYYITVYGRLNV